MPKFWTSHPTLPQSRRSASIPTPHLPSRSVKRLSCIAVGVITSLVAVLYPIQSWANAPSPAPTELKTLLSQIETAANQHNVNAVLQHYSPTFKHQDGLTYETLRAALTDLWKRYPDLRYQTQVTSWKQDGKGMVVETETQIRGTQTANERQFALDATMRSRQRIENQKIVQQEILAERSKVTTGSRPPLVTLNLPATVKPGQEFAFDAIVQEPLGDDVLLGAALEEPVKPAGFLAPTTTDLEPLLAGGIFKVGRAPAKPDSRWISAILVRHDGITFLTQRLRVENATPSRSSK